MDYEKLYRQRAYYKAKALEKPEIQPYLKELCKQDIVFWINNFCFTFDPRVGGNTPFFLWPFQEWSVRLIKECIENGKDVGVEKSRDMGVSWLIIMVYQHGWLFEEGWDTLVGSRKQDEVDKANEDPSTLFGKFRYNLRRLPNWMKPKHSSKLLSIENKDNGNFFTGESANPFFGRGQRKKSVLFDELAFWASASDAFGGCEAVTNSRVIVSTPYGNTNRYAQEMLNPNNTVMNYPELDEILKAKGLK